MDFTNEFRVSLPAGQAWALLTDLERIAPCMPGAQLTGVDGDQYNGVVKIKVGPMTVQYKGVASFEEQDAEARTAVLKARGRDVRGQGNADARVAVRLLPDGDGTRVVVETRLTITGKVAQFGKGMIEEISKKLLAQFADALERQFAADTAADAADNTADAADNTVADTAAAEEPAVASAASGAPAASEPAAAPEPAAGTSPAPTTTVPRPVPAAAAVEPLDLMSIARGAVLKRAIPLIAAVVVVVAVVVWLTR